MDTLHFTLILLCAVLILHTAILQIRLDNKLDDTKELKFWKRLASGKLMKRHK